MKKKTKLLLNLALTLFFLIMIIVKGPNLNPLYSDGAFAWCFIFSSYVVLNFLIGLGGIRVTTDQSSHMSVSVDKNVKGIKTGITLLVCRNIHGSQFFQRLQLCLIHNDCT